SSHGLQSVFKNAQEPISLTQRAAIIGGHQAQADAGVQGGQKTGRAQPAFATAAQNLQALDQKLQLADAAASTLDVLTTTMLAGAGADASVQVTQILEDTVVEIASVDERLQGLDQGASSGKIAPHRRGLHPCIALPGATFADKVLFHGG